MFEYRKDIPLDSVPGYTGEEPGLDPTSEQIVQTDAPNATFVYGQDIPLDGVS